MPTEQELTDQWLQRLRAGDIQALGELFDYFRPRLRRMIEIRMGGTLERRVDAGDVLQDVFVDATTKIVAYLERPEVSLFVWLRRITWDRLLKVLRHHFGAQCRAVQRDVQLPEQSSMLLVRALLDLNSPSGQVIRSELRERVQQAIQSLPADDQEVILMRHYEALSNREVAESLGISATAATMRHGRALARLRNSLENSAGDWWT